MWNDYEPGSFNYSSPSPRNARPRSAAGRGAGGGRGRGRGRGGGATPTPTPTTVGASKQGRSGLSGQAQGVTSSTASAKSGQRRQVGASESGPGAADTVDGRRVKEIGLKKLGIMYDRGPISPMEIFQKIQSEHLPACLHGHGSKFLTTYDEHVTKLQKIFSEIFDLQQDSFDLLEVCGLMEEWHQWQNLKIPIKQEDDKAANGDESMEEKKNRANNIGRKILGEIIRAQKNAQKRKTAFVDSSQPIVWMNIVYAIEQVDDFLESLTSVLKDSFQPEINEKMFGSLFRDFARIFSVRLKYGLKRTLKFGSLKVTSENDLRFDFVPDSDEVLNTDQRKALVTVHVVNVEVKRYVKESSDSTGAPPMKKLRCTATTPEKSSSSKSTPHDDIELPTDLRGQHGIQLLAAMDHSCLEPTSTNSMVLGMIVQATLVRLTCLDIKHKDFKEVQEHRPQTPAKRIGTIYYTKAFDMLTQDGRMNLIFIMRHLLFLSNSSADKKLPRI